MSKFTDFLNLFMWDSIEDSEEEFNIDKALNDNWKKIDTKVKTHVTSVNEEINNFKEETNQKIENIQALPTGGTKGQVLTKQSETNGDANWEDIEANEVFIGNEEEAPETAKIIVEEDDLEESSTLGKSEVYVGAEEPTAGEKVWFKNDNNSIYVRNSNGVYEEFTKNDNVILYNNVDGSNEDITLNDNSDNYKYIDIYYRQQDGTYSFIRALPNTTVALSAPHVTDNGYAIGWAVRNIKISGNKITTATTNRYLFINVVSTNSLSGASKTNNIYITKVVGYK